MNFRTKDKKNTVIVLLALLSLIKIGQGDYEFTFWILTAVLLSACWDFFINKAFYKRKVLPKSAMITGFIVGGILEPSAGWLSLVIFSFLAIVSKHILRLRKIHIFNPANLALFLATLFRYPLTWGIEASVPLIIIVGLYLAYSFKKFPHVLGFLILFSSFTFYLERINPFHIISWFFLFIMLIEPKTSGYGIWKGFAFGAIAGTGSFLTFKYLPQIDFYVAGLFIANLLRLPLDRLLKR